MIYPKSSTLRQNISRNQWKLSTKHIWNKPRGSGVWARLEKLNYYGKLSLFEKRTNKINIIGTTRRHVYVVAPVYRAKYCFPISTGPAELVTSRLVESHRTTTGRTVSTPSSSRRHRRWRAAPRSVVVFTCTSVKVMFWARAHFPLCTRAVGTAWGGWVEASRFCFLLRV